MAWCPTDDIHNIDGLLQDCSNSIAYAVELLQFCNKQSIWTNEGLFNF